MAADWYVRAGDPNAPDNQPGTIAEPFTRISTAVARAAAGDTIHLFTGTYREAVVLDKPNLTLRGEPGANAVISTDGLGQRGISLSANGLTVKNVKIRNTTNPGNLPTPSRMSLVRLRCWIVPAVS